MKQANFVWREFQKLPNSLNYGKARVLDNKYGGGSETNYRERRDLMMSDLNLILLTSGQRQEDGI